MLGNNKQGRNNETIILVWNSAPNDPHSKCLKSDMTLGLDLTFQSNLTLGLDRSFPNMYSDLSPNFTCPFKCTLTRDRNLYEFIFEF